jgi:hypothetical protein
MADSWSPEEDEVRIYFERVDEGEAGTRPARAPRSAGERAPEADNESYVEPSSAEMDDRIHELCAALAEAERGGHAFIALKWFRDSFLPRKSYGWNQNPGVRQAVLAEAIQRNLVLTGKVANPKTAAYPTTTIRLSRTDAGTTEESQALQPVAPEEEAVAVTTGEE